MAVASTVGGKLETLKSNGRVGKKRRAKNHSRAARYRLSSLYRRTKKRGKRDARSSRREVQTLGKKRRQETGEAVQTPSTSKSTSHH